MSDDEMGVLYQRVPNLEQLKKREKNKKAIQIGGSLTEGGRAFDQKTPDPEQIKKIEKGKKKEQEREHGKK